MSAATVITLGYGAQAGGSAAFVLTLGYNTAGAAPPPPAPVATGGAGGLITFIAGRGVDWAEVEKRKLEIALAKKEAELKRVEKRIKTVEKKAEKSEHPEGILANLGSLIAKKSEVINEIETIQVNLYAVLDFLNKLDFEDDDEDLLFLL